MDGVLAAIGSYENRLRHGRPDDLEDFWDRQRNGLPLPKEEERVSDKVCDAIRAYFEKYAVVADREVQIFRRKLPRAVAPRSCHASHPPLPGERG